MARRMLSTVSLGLFLSSFTLLFLPGKVSAAGTCCDPYKNICLMYLDPRCDINSCSETCQPIVINNGLDNYLHCDNPLYPGSGMCVSSLQVVDGSVEVAGVQIK